MSRSYGLGLTITDCNPEKKNDIIKFLDEEFYVDEDELEFDKGGKLITTSSDVDVSLGGGESEKEFVHRLWNGVWRANEAYCEVEVTLVYLDDPPTEFYISKKKDYDPSLKL